MVVTRTAAIIAVAGMTIALLPLLRAQASEFRRRTLDATLALLALASLVMWLAPARLPGRPQAVHSWEQFHYQLSAKYYDELGHDGLYSASLMAQVERHPDMRLSATSTDLRTNQQVPTQSLRRHAEEVKARFTPERWSAFVADHEEYLALILKQGGEELLARIRSDHGFNGTPAWVVEARLLGAALPVSPSSQAFLGCLDLILLLLALLAISRAFDSRTACLVAVAFGTGHAWDSYWIGGALLRLDWIVAILLAVCAARRERYALTGALIAHATLMRVFPVVFLLGPAVVGLRAWRGGSRRMLLRGAAGFTLVIAVGLVAGSSTGRGPHAWTDFAVNLRKHEATWLANNVGLKNVVAYDGEILAGRFEDSPQELWGDRLDANVARHRVAFATLALAFVALAALAAWRARPDEAVALGIVPAFALFVLTCYYWVMLLAAIPYRGRRLVAFVLGLGIATRIVDSVLCAESETTYGVMSWALAAGLFAWCLHVIRRGDETHPAVASAQETVP